MTRYSYNVISFIVILAQDLVFSDDDADQESHHYEPEDEEPEHPQAPEHPQVVSTSNCICCLVIVRARGRE
jgi:hypothetical protein